MQTQNKKQQVYRVFQITKNGVYPIDMCLEKDRKRVTIFHANKNIIFGKIKLM